jgi:microcystin-dependent protein
MANAALLATLGDQTSSQAAGAISVLMPAGVILPYGGGTAPTGWLLCDGSAISRTTYASLFAAIGTSHGYGDNSTTFNLPDFRGRFMRGVDGTANRDPDKGTRTSAATGGNTGNNVGSAQTNATAKNGLTASAASVSTSVSGAKNQMNGTSGGQSASHSHGIGTDGWHDHMQYVTANPGLGPYNTRHDYNYDANNLQIYDHVRTGGGGSHSHGGGTGGQSVDHSHSWDFGATTFSASGTTPAQTVTVGNGDNETRPLNINVNYIIKV